MESKKLSNELSKQESICGVVMPISSIDGCNESHWSDVLNIHTDAIESAGFTANLVSNADDVGVIQKRIIHNLYSNPIVVCDVSGKNPNVMLELGMRLAFDRAVVIVKDDKTDYSFDTSPIEHLTYPRDLRFTKIIEFKKELETKIRKTYEAAEEDAKYSPFLKHFGDFKVAKISTKEVSSEEYILDELRSLKSLVYNTSARNNFMVRPRSHDVDLCVRCKEAKPGIALEESLRSVDGVVDVKFAPKKENGHFHIYLKSRKAIDINLVLKIISDIHPKAIVAVH